VQNTQGELMHNIDSWSWTN